MAEKAPRSRSRRAALAASSPRAGKARRGRAPVAELPVTIHASRFELPDDVGLHVRSKLGAKLQKLAPRLESASVRFIDINGPKGGIDIECRIKLAIDALPTLVVSERGADARRAFDSAVSTAVRVVQRALQRAGFSQGGAKRSRKSSRGAATKASAEPDAPAAEAPARKPARNETQRRKDHENLARRARDKAVAPQARAAVAGAQRK